MFPAAQALVLLSAAPSGPRGVPLLSDVSSFRPPSPRPDASGCVPTSDPLSEGTINFNKQLIDSAKAVLDGVYAGRDFQRFYVLETIARVPYFAYLSCLHLYESFGLRSEARRMRTHYAEADNELHHLLIMEELGGSKFFVDRFVAQHVAFFYYWFIVGVYLTSPRSAYHLSELIEHHAYHTYDTFLSDHRDELLAKPVPEAARQYYEADDPMRAYMYVGDEDGSGDGPTPAADHHLRAGGGRPLSSLYDVFVRVRDDEAAHWEALCSLTQFETLDPPDDCELGTTEWRPDERDANEGAGGGEKIGSLWKRGVAWTKTG